MKRPTALVAGVVLAASLVPLGPGSGSGSPVHALAHLAGYGALAWLLSDEHPVALAVLAASGFGLAVEGLQALVAWRTGSLLDAATNLAGALVGGWLVRHRSGGTAE